MAAFVRAVNAGRVDEVIDAFAERALVNDQLREYWGRSAIALWAAREVVGQRLTMRVTKTVSNYDHTVVQASVDGNFDKRGLPDPLLVTFYFSTREDRVTQLIILRNENDD
jgi:hypothetical protein